MATHVQIARLISDRGFGFIRTETGEEVFFHASALDMTGRMFPDLAEGDPVEVEVTDGPKGPRAAWVRCAR